MSTFVLGEGKKWLKRSTPFASRFMFLYGHRRGGGTPPKHFFVFVGGIFGTSGHHCEPLDVLLPSFGTFLTVCPQRFWLNRLFDSTSSKLSPGVWGRGGSVIT